MAWFFWRQAHIVAQGLRLGQAGQAYGQAADQIAQIVGRVRLRLGQVDAGLGSSRPVRRSAARPASGPRRRLAAGHPGVIGPGRAADGLHGHARTSSGPGEGVDIGGGGGFGGGSQQHVVQAGCGIEPGERHAGQDALRRQGLDHRGGRTGSRRANSLKKRGVSTRRPGTAASASQRAGRRRD